MTIGYSQRNFSEVIEVDSANINVLNFKLIDSSFHISSIFYSTGRVVSSSVNVYDIHKFKSSYFLIDSFNFVSPSPLVIQSRRFLFGKDRRVVNSQEIRLVNENYETINSVEFNTKGNFNFPTQPGSINGDMYLPSYIENGDQEYFSITKVTSDLKILWTKYFNEEYAYSVPAEILSAPDSNLYVSSNVYVKEKRRYYNQLLKLDTAGNVIWEFFNTEELEHGAVSPWFTTLSDSNLVVSYRVDRFTNDTFRTRGLHFIPYRLIWLDPNGELIKKKYYVSNRLKRFFISNVERGRHDYFFIMGQWDDGEALESKNLLIKLNNQGDSLWHRTYYHPDYSLDSVALHIEDIHEFEDGRIAVLSMISTPYDYNKIWLFMVDSNGNCLTDNCISEGEVVGVSSYDVSYEKLKLYPNPSSGLLSWDDRIQLRQLTVYDLMGRKVLQYDGEWLNSIRVDHLSSGKYILLGSDREGRHYRTKFIKHP